MRAVRGLHPYTKFTLSLSVSLLAVLLDRWFSLAALAAVSGAIFLLSRPGRGALLSHALISGTTVWGLVVSQGLFYQDYPRTVLFCLLPPGDHFAGLCLVREGLRHGLVQSLRLLASLSAGLYLVSSTPQETLFRAITALPLPRGLSLMATAAVRFLPAVAEQLKLVRQAMRLRGYRPLRGGVRHTLRTELAVVHPLLFSAVSTARRLADALLTRGFDPLSRARPAGLPPWPAAERAASALLAALAGAVLLAKVLFWLYLQEVWYVEGLRGLYHLVRTCL